MMIIWLNVCIKWIQPGAAIRVQMDTNGINKNTLLMYFN